MKVRAEDRALQGRRKHVGQQQIGHRLKLVAGRRMPGNFNSQSAQLLYQAPHFGAARTNLVGDLGAAHDHGSVVHQQTHNPPQAQVRPLRRGIVWPRATRPRSLPESPSVASFVMQRIMRERERKNKSRTDLT